MHGNFDWIYITLFWLIMGTGFFLGLWSGFTIILKANKYEKKKGSGND